MKSIVFLAVFLTLPLLCPAEDAVTQASPVNSEETQPAAKPGLSKEEIIKIASEAVTKEVPEAAEMNVVFDEGNKLWQEKAATLDEEAASNYDFLKEKNYQAVYFAPKDAEGAGIWAFIDNASGEVLMLFGEE
jgi:hypothetical protein